MTNVVNFAEFRRFSTTALVGAIAIAATTASSAGLDISPLFENAWIRRGELWRLLTSAFPHANAAHLLFNIYWLWEFGRRIEQVFGHLNTALFIGLFAIGSSAFEFAFAAGGIGLSGVGYGLLGLLWVLWRRDARFHGAINRGTVWLFVAWFALCIVLTVRNIFVVANIAHGVGFVFGVLTGIALISSGPKRTLAAATVCGLLLFGLWGATLGRPIINLASHAGYEEAEWGYEALIAHRDEEAVRWLRDASLYRPEIAEIWTDLGIAYERIGDDELANRAYAYARQLKNRSGGQGANN